MNVNSWSANSALVMEVKKDAVATVKQMAEQEKEILSKKYKGKAIKALLSSVVGFIFCVAAVVVFLMSGVIFSMGNIYLWVVGAMLALGIVISIIGIIFQIIYLCYSMDEAAAACIRDKMLRDIREGRTIWQAHRIEGKVVIVKNNILFQTRVSPKPILLLDFEKGTFILNKGAQYSAEYKLKNILRYDVYENGEEILIAREDIMQTIYEGSCHSLQLVISMVDSDVRSLSIEYVANTTAPNAAMVTLDKRSAEYRRIRDNIKAVCHQLDTFTETSREDTRAAEAFFEEKLVERKNASVETVAPIAKIAEEKKETPVVSVEEEKKAVPMEKTKKEMLLELKELLNDGLITQEDYEQKKKQILGL